MFKKFRKRINAVLPDIENLQISTITSPSTSYPIDSPSQNDQTRSKSAPWLQTKRINFDAGCSLLEQNENDWREIHSKNELNAKKAGLCDQLIKNVLKNIETSSRNLNEIELLLDNTQYLIQSINECSTIVIKLNEACSDVENSLFELEDLFDVLELQERQLDSKFEMAMYKEQKLGMHTTVGFCFICVRIYPVSSSFHNVLANLEKMRQTMAVKHAETIKINERKMRAIQIERQAAFEDAFKSDLDYYKQVGKIPSK